MRKKSIAWSTVIGWMALIFILSHQPASVSSGLSSGVTEFLLDIAGNIFPEGETEVEQFHTFIRKNAHFFAYFLLGILLVNAIGNWNNLRDRDLLTSFIIAMLYAASDEFHQLFIDGRSGELRDVLIDSAGAATGIFVCWIAAVFLQKRNKQSV